MVRFGFGGRERVSNPAPLPMMAVKQFPCRALAGDFGPKAPPAQLPQVTRRSGTGSDAV